MKRILDAPKGSLVDGIEDEVGKCPKTFCSYNLNLKLQATLSATLTAPLVQSSSKPIPPSTAAFIAITTFLTELHDTHSCFNSYRKSAGNVLKVPPKYLSIQ